MKSIGDTATITFSRYLGLDIWDHFILSVAGYPNRTMEQTQFVANCCRELSHDRTGHQLGRNLGYP
jgi:hypothetical protein